MRKWTRRTLAVLGVAAVALAATVTDQAVAPRPARALDNGVARTPPMGWNTWNTFGCNINETLIRQTADAIVANGLRDLGYKYVVVDDCWFNPNRDAQGNLQAHPQRFPSGMKSLGDYLHARGLLFGIYQVPLDKTCAQVGGAFPGATGSLNHEYQDARQFAAWGVDYLKYDWCSGTGTINDQVARFGIMRDALASTGRPIVYSINPNSYHAKTGPQRNWSDVANLWRTTEDITNAWNTGQTNGYPMGIQNIVDVTVPLAGYAAPGGFNDPDMLEVGNGGMNDTEMRSHFALWSMLAAPLMMGNDVRSASAATLAILRNANLVAINQDTLGRQAVQVSFDGTRRVLAKPLANGDVAVALFNQGSSTTTVSTTAAAVGKSGSSFTLRDAWTDATSSSSGAISASVPAHGTVVYRVSGGGTTTPPPVPTTFRLRSESSGRCLDVDNAGTANGTGTLIWDCHNNANQQFTANGQALQVLGKCLDVPTNATAGTRVQIWDCNGGTNQQWTINGNGTVSNVRFPSLCLDVDNAGTANGTRVIVWTCHGNTNQRWSRV
ncbi:MULTISPECIES: glycoside hydrolase family 27 protein [Micromonospora]|uniref:Alpha-galactosidase n=1 Tax=Micromonospora tulbaghiae TaxID=479978 RepID=A0A386WK99_9ACTN|nr:MULTISPECIES: glycoside hydrolase family 27 protein [Micromonospora]AYF27124.1 alpha-galactosidase [Micromonospora tulbaghiae]MCO1613491.1 RICIN domain-containing protein [Micromonospora sp. CPM1]NED56666.1 alpha-galactosidase [Micromonospora aurantiaca]